MGLFSRIKGTLTRIVEVIAPDLLFSSRLYSQDGEDMVLKAFYEKKRGYKGFYVDIGAHHPYRFSNTAFFYKKGWRGINIEPTPGLIRSFNRVRRRDINLNIGIAGANSKLTLYEFNEPALNSFDRELSLLRENGRYKIITETEVQVYPLAEVLERYLPDNQRIDFLNVDVEGLDLVVLQSNDWTRFSPEFVLVEGEFDAENLAFNEIYTFLKGKNYMLACRTFRTSIFRKND